MHGLIRKSDLAINHKLADDILEYLEILQAIATYKVDAADNHTPYQLEIRRKDAHDRLFNEDILPLLTLKDGFTEDDAYLRSKDLFSNLDKIWKIYDLTDFDITDGNCIRWLQAHLYHFLLTTETLYYLEGVTGGIHGIHV